MCSTKWGKDNRNLVKVVWTCTKKATRGTNQKNRLHDFLSCEKEKGETNKDVRRIRQGRLHAK